MMHACKSSSLLNVFVPAMKCYAAFAVHIHELWRGILIINHRNLSPRFKKINNLGLYLIEFFKERRRSLSRLKIMEVDWSLIRNCNIMKR